VKKNSTRCIINGSTGFSFSLFFFFLSNGVWTKGLVLGMQVLYHEPDPAQYWFFLTGLNFALALQGTPNALEHYLPHFPVPYAFTNSTLQSPKIEDGLCDLHSWLRHMQEPFQFLSSLQSSCSVLTLEQTAKRWL
jgi:hypothetical protein